MRNYKLILFFILFSVSFSNSEEIKIYRIGVEKPKIILISGIHGDEVAGVVLLKELLLKQFIPQKGSLIIIPEANEAAVKENKRTPYYMEDLNRSFPGNDSHRSGKIAKAIFEIIEKENPSLILDFHESHFSYLDNSDSDIAIGNSIIIEEKSFSQLENLVLELDLNILNGSPKGSLNYEVNKQFNIPILTIETSKDEKLEERKNKMKNILMKCLRYLEME